MSPEELGLPLRDVQNAIKVLKSVGHLLKISGHETGERGVTYRVMIPTLAVTNPTCRSRNWSTRKPVLRLTGT